MDNLKLSKFYIMEGLLMKTITKTAAIGNLMFGFGDFSRFRGNNAE